MHVVIVYNVALPAASMPYLNKGTVCIEKKSVQYKIHDDKEGGEAK